MQDGQAKGPSRTPEVVQKSEGASLTQESLDIFEGQRPSGKEPEKAGGSKVPKPGKQVSYAKEMVEITESRDTAKDEAVEKVE